MPPNGSVQDSTSAPLADYFWIAGVDSLSYGHHFRLNPNTGEKETNGVSTSSRPLDSPIDEDHALETTRVRTPPAPILPSDTLDDDPRHSKISNESRYSIINGGLPESSRATASNRSSATIRPVPALNDDDFDRALRKFTSERDSFLDELSVTAGASSSPRTNFHVKAAAARPSHKDDSNGLGSGSPNVRRHFSLRDLNSMKRQPSMARTGTFEPFLVDFSSQNLLRASRPGREDERSHP